MNSKLILSKNIKMDKNYNNVIDYSEDQMVKLCRDNIVAEADDYQFIRTNIRPNSILCGFDYNLCLQANYIAFQNPDYSGKWFFAWIDDVLYQGDGNTVINFTVDSWSTWFSKLQVKPCYVLREHVNDDTVGLHTVQEGLDIGDIISDSERIVNELGAESSYYIVIASNYDPTNKDKYAGVGMYAGYAQGSMWFAWEINRYNDTTINAVSNWVNEIVKQKHGDDITAMFAVPYQSFNLNDIDETSHMVKNGKAKKLNQDLTYSKSTWRGFSDYNPKNNKLFTYPYSYVRVTNNLGSYNDYKIEDFNEVNEEGNITDNMIFNLIGIPCIGYSGKIRPKDYKGIHYNEDESLQLGKYPTLSWSTDAFTNWITQNSINLAVGLASTVAGGSISIGTNIAKGKVIDAASGIVSTSASIANTIGTIDKALALPNTAEGNANSGDISFVENLNRFKIMHMRPKKEFLKRIDNYFSKFGYKIDEVKSPNIRGRRNWNYVEIAQSEEIGYGSIPSIYMSEINQSCRKGVTIWHNHSNLGNFDVDNSIV